MSRPARAAWSATWPAPAIPGGSPAPGALRRGPARVRRYRAATRCDRAAEIIAAKGGAIADITVGDVLELLDIEPGDLSAIARRGRGVLPAAARAGDLRAGRSGGCGSSAPPASSLPRSSSTATTSSAGPSATCSWTTCANASPALDYTSLKALAYHLGKRFWQDLEQHHPGIDSLNLSREVADAWKQRQRTKPKTVTAADGRRPSGHGPADRLPPVPDPRAGLLPGPVPVGARGSRPLGAVGRALPRQPGRDQPAQVRAPPQGPHGRAHPRTAARPAGPGPHRRRAAQEAAGLLEAARQARPGEPFTAAGQTLARVVTRRGTAPGRIWADDPGQGSAATSASKTITRSGPGRRRSPPAHGHAGSRNSWRSATTA